MEEQNKPQPIQINTNENNLGTIVHLLGLFTWFIGPLIMYLLYKETASQNLKENMINTINWQISYGLYMLISFFLILVIIGLIGIFVLIILDIVFSIIGAIDANKGKVYKYPLAISFIK